MAKTQKTFMRFYGTPEAKIRECVELVKTISRFKSYKIKPLAMSMNLYVPGTDNHEVEFTFDDAAEYAKFELPTVREIYTRYANMAGMEGEIELRRPGEAVWEHPATM